MQVERVDHVHLEVQDRDRAADWYKRVLGLVRASALGIWADHPMGPLILSGGDGRPALALFARDCALPSRDATIAFRVDGTAFLHFLRNLESLDLRHLKGHQLSSADLVDHGLAWSIYFVDPDNNHIEVTTYNYNDVISALEFRS